jgi:hypothetical protein
VLEETNTPGQIKMTNLSTIANLIKIMKNAREIKDMIHTNTLLIHRLNSAGCPVDSLYTQQEGLRKAATALDTLCKDLSDAQVR